MTLREQPQQVRVEQHEHGQHLEPPHPHREDEEHLRRRPERAVGLHRAERPEEDQDYLTRASDLLPAEPWSENVWQDWTSALKQETGRKGRALFMPLRMALTGLDHGPELAALLPLIGREETLRRLP